MRTLLALRPHRHPAGQRLLGVTQVVGHLQVHPEFRRRFEKRSQPDRRVPLLLNGLLVRQILEFGKPFFSPSL